MTPDEYSARDGIALGQLISKGEVSAQEVRRAAIEAIERLNPKLNAVIATCFETARAAPEVSGTSPLSGVTFLLKDVNLYDKEMPTRFASRFFSGARPKGDSAMVASWRRAGLSILGKTNTPEFAGEFVTEPATYGPALNPWNAAHTVGGSSGGAGAAVASGMVPIAHGTDLGGSIRIPAACCGVFGFKPSVGLNPLGPFVEEIAGGLDSDHVLTRTVRDSAASLDITSVGAGGFLEALDAPLRRLRIGVAALSPEGIVAGPNQRAALDRTAARLSELGHELSEYRYPAEAGAGPWFDPLWMMDVHHLVARACRRDWPATRARRTRAFVAPRVRHHREPERGRLFRSRMAKQIAALALDRSMERLDIVLTPTLAADPVPLGELAYTKFPTVEAWGTAGYGFAPFSAPANIAGQPSASLPAGLTPDNLPIGVQITGRSGQDALVLRLARLIEEAMPWPLLAPR